VVTGARSAGLGAAWLRAAPLADALSRARNDSASRLTACGLAGVPAPLAEGAGVGAFETAAEPFVEAGAVAADGAGALDGAAEAAGTSTSIASALAAVAEEEAATGFEAVEPALLAAATGVGDMAATLI